MLNFNNLSDVDFEYLCKDIMSKKLGGIQLYRFGKGRDGGIDLKGKYKGKTIIVQVKHYIKTDVSGLIHSLKNELHKVEKLHPDQYYVCCSKELSPQRKTEIYELFSDYMDSEDNIVTLLEMEEFLDLKDNDEILSKHYKLWIGSTNVLSNMFFGEINYDSEVLMEEMQDTIRMFVKTSIFDRALERLKTDRFLIMLGDPGVGKSITSKMLALTFAKEGYHLRYTTNGSDIATLKRVISKDSNRKEIILLDDCFGQIYFDMKHYKERELLSLIRGIHLNPNKILLINSRITIYNDSRNKNIEWNNYLAKTDYEEFVIALDDLTKYEKAQILYNHLYYNHVREEYFANLIKDKRYDAIISHINFNPRIIEFCTLKGNYSSMPENQYYDFFIKNLDNPEKAWEDEYINVLDNTDRILLNTIYSLTNTLFPLDAVKEVYNYRLKTETIDNSINQFEKALNKLQRSMVKIVDIKGSRIIGVANPSINDFLHKYLLKNENESKKIISSARYFVQLKRMMKHNEYECFLKKWLKEGTATDYEFESYVQKISFITYWCLKWNILEAKWDEYVNDYLLHIGDFDLLDGEVESNQQYLKQLFNSDFTRYYDLQYTICTPYNFEEILYILDLKTMVVFLKNVDYFFYDEDGDYSGEYNWYIDLVCQYLGDKIFNFCTNLFVDDYDIDITSIISNCRTHDETLFTNVDRDLAKFRVDEIVENVARKELEELLADLPKEFSVNTSDYYYEVIGSDWLVDKAIDGPSTPKKLVLNNFLNNQEELIKDLFER